MPIGIARTKFVHVGATPKWTLSTSTSGSKTEEAAPISTSSSWVRKSTTASSDVDAGRLLDADDVDRAEDGDHDAREDDVAGRVLELVPEQAAEVVRDEERARWRS